jgi:hypothetical protein
VPKPLTEVLAQFDESSFAADSPEPSGLCVIPLQYDPTQVPRPYQRLLLAVLEDAIRCFQRNCGATSGRRRILFREAQEWLFDPDGTSFMSCRVVCESLGIQATPLRRYLRDWRIRMSRGLRAPRLPRRAQCR